MAGSYPTYDTALSSNPSTEGPPETAREIQQLWNECFQIHKELSKSAANNSEHRRQQRHLLAGLRAQLREVQSNSSDNLFPLGRTETIVDAHPPTSASCGPAQTEKAAHNGSDWNPYNTWRSEETSKPEIVPCPQRLDQTRAAQDTLGRTSLRADRAGGSDSPPHYPNYAGLLASTAGRAVDPEVEAEPALASVANLTRVAAPLAPEATCAHTADSPSQPLLQPILVSLENFKAKRTNDFTPSPKQADRSKVQIVSSTDPAKTCGGVDALTVRVEVDAGPNAISPSLSGLNADIRKAQEQTPPALRKDCFAAFAGAYAGIGRMHFEIAKEQQAQAHTTEEMKALEDAHTREVDMLELMIAHALAEQKHLERKLAELAGSKDPARQSDIEIDGIAACIGSGTRYQTPIAAGQTTEFFEIMTRTSLLEEEPERESFVPGPGHGPLLGTSLLLPPVPGPTGNLSPSFFSFRRGT